MSKADDIIDSITEKIYKIIRDEFKPDSRVEFAELSEKQRDFYRKNVISILILDDNSWDFFHREWSDE